MTLKVLYISCYKDGTGYAHAAIDNILALDAAGVDVVPRKIKLNNYEGAIPERILELETKSARDSDIVIQHTLPSMMEYNGHFTANVAMYCSETDNFKNSNWPEHLNMMDMLIVPNLQMYTAARVSEVDTKIRTIPYPTDISKFERSYKKVNLPELQEDNFIFYTIGENTRRKNFAALLQAFHSEFDMNEPVSLLIKTSSSKYNPKEAKKDFQAFCNKIKTGLRLRKEYKQEIVITDSLTDESIYRLHNTCDCFVSTSYGEAWCIPAFDAMGFGKTPIVPRHTGFKGYIDDDRGWLVECTYEQVFGMNEAVPTLYTGDEYWYQIHISHLRQCMRAAYQSKDKREAKAEAGIQHAYGFSYEKIGQKLKRELELIYEQKSHNLTKAVRSSQ